MNVTTVFVPGGDKGVARKLNSPNISEYYSGIFSFDFWKTYYGKIGVYLRLHKAKEFVKL